MRHRERERERERERKVLSYLDTATHCIFREKKTLKHLKKTIPRAEEENC